MGGSLNLSGSRSNSTVSNPEAMGAAKSLVAYLNGMDTSNVDQTYQNIAQNALNLSTGLPNYIYDVGASDEARQQVIDASYNLAAGNLNSQYASDLASLETRLQNQGIAVGSDAYKNSLEGLQKNLYLGLNNAAYDAMTKGQDIYSSQLNNAISAAGFNNSARGMSLSEILQILQQSVSGYDAAHDKYNALAAASSKKTKSSSVGADINMDGSDISSAVTAMGAYSDARLKENITAVGKLDNGLTVYRFNYIGSRITQIGIIAQEVMMTKPDAVFEDENGCLMVDYIKATKK